MLQWMRCYLRLQHGFKYVSAFILPFASIAWPSGGSRSPCGWMLLYACLLRKCTHGRQTDGQMDGHTSQVAFCFIYWGVMASNICLNSLYSQSVRHFAYLQHHLTPDSIHWCDSYSVACWVTGRPIKIVVDPRFWPTHTSNHISVKVIPWPCQRELSTQKDQWRPELLNLSRRLSKMHSETDESSA